MVDFSNDILELALNRPTTDLEDNVQLHSAVQADCDFFLTEDNTLLALKFFGKLQISKQL